MILDQARPTLDWRDQAPVAANAESGTPEVCVIKTLAHRAFAENHRVLLKQGNQPERDVAAQPRPIGPR
jgi:hypothetical protein